METREPIIRFHDFSFQYYSQAEPTLHDINLEIYPQEKVLIIGPSGSGKSTLAHCINGLIPHAYKDEITGGLTIAGNDAKARIFERSKAVGTVLQDTDAQFVGLSVAEDIAFALENDCVSQNDMHARVHSVAKTVDIEGILRNSPFEISGGQKQRATLAGVMVDEVGILLFDEPLANLDPATGKSAIEIIDRLHRTEHKTTLIIEHRLEDVLHCPVDRVILMNDGRIIADMTPHALCASDLLIRYGIREPLYLSALKKAGIAITEQMQPGYIETLRLSDQQRAQYIQWNERQQDYPNAVSDEVALQLEHVNFSYSGKQDNVSDANMEIHRGEMVSIIGRNGAGKSTLSKLITGLERPDGGVVRCMGRDLKNDSIKEIADHIGIVMQNPNHMISKAMIFDEVALGLRYRGVAEEETRQRVADALEICGLSPFVDWPISALSYGQKKRVTIASILVLNPEVIILDEPTAGQDFRHYTEIMEYLVRINRTGMTVILVTHDMHLMLEYTPRAIAMNNGQIIADDCPSNILTDPGVIARANLKETSLYTLCERLGIVDGTHYVQNFINCERREREQ